MLVTRAGQGLSLDGSANFLSDKMWLEKQMTDRPITRPLLAIYSKDMGTRMEANVHTYCVLSGSHIAQCQRQSGSDMAKAAIGNTAVFIANVGNTDVFIVNVANIAVFIVNVGNNSVFIANVGNTAVFIVNVGNIAVFIVNVGNTAVFIVNVANTAVFIVNVGLNINTSNYPIIFL